MQDGTPFLGSVDKLGTAFEDKAICTGYGVYLGVPLLRDTLKKKPKLNEDEAKKLVHDCMEVLFYRDARSFPKYQLGVIKEDGVTIEGPIDVEQNWNLALQ